MSGVPKWVRPFYLAEMCVQVSTLVARLHLCSSTLGDLVIPLCRTMRYGQRSVTVSCPTLWNCLPQTTRSRLLSFVLASNKFVLQSLRIAIISPPSGGYDCEELRYINVLNYSSIFRRQILQLITFFYCRTESPMECCKVLHSLHYRNRT